MLSGGQINEKAKYLTSLLYLAATEIPDTLNMTADLSIAAADGGAGAGVMDYRGDDNDRGSGADDNGDNGIEVARVVPREVNDNMIYHNIISNITVACFIP